MTQEPQLHTHVINARKVRYTATREQNTLTFLYDGFLNASGVLITDKIHICNRTCSMTYPLSRWQRKYQVILSEKACLPFWIFKLKSRLMCNILATQSSIYFVTLSHLDT